jgi:ethanolamine utilization microcompartment shell protein EutS
VAPHANIVAYKVCNPSCPETASVAAVDYAIGTDQVDVINYSISGSDSPWTDPVDLAFLDAFSAGIFVSASAGNAGPGASTVAHTGPWNSSVAASTHSRIIANTLDITAAGGNLAGLAAVPGEAVVIASDITDNIRWAGDVSPTNIDACVAFPAGSFTGVVGLAQRGNCNFSDKVDNLHNAGAVGAVIYNNVGDRP